MENDFGVDQANVWGEVASKFTITH